MKLLFRRYASLFTSKIKLQERVDTLKKENEGLRVKLTAAQNEKTVAAKQAEELRAQKERLRAKIAALKKDDTQQAKVIQQLNETMIALQEERDLLAKKAQGFRSR